LAVNTPPHGADDAQLGVHDGQLAARAVQLGAGRFLSGWLVLLVVSQELFAYVNDREVALGLLSEIRRLDIGTNPRATIVITGAHILPRHVLLRRDGDMFRLRNLSRTPRSANGVVVGPRRRARVVLPLDLELAENIKVALRVREAQDAEHARIPGGKP
jgi:hypothetical protein